MSTKTTKKAVTEVTTKSVPATGGKRLRQAGSVGGPGSEPATKAAPSGRKRRKPFVL
jgi:hypothetical protein